VRRESGQIVTQPPQQLTEVSRLSHRAYSRVQGFAETFCSPRKCRAFRFGIAAVKVVTACLLYDGMMSADHGWLVQDMAC
jgi:hypothetical protein